MGNKARRAEDFAVRRWLQWGAASAGVGAALLGWSLMGPEVGVAAADRPDQSTSVSAGPAGKATAGPKSSRSATKASGAKESRKSLTSAANRTVTARLSASTKSAAARVNAGPAKTTATTTAAPAIDEAARDQAVAKQIADFMSAGQAVISGLPVGADAKEFLNGGLVLVRRTFLNQDPTVAPIQISGQITGPVVGTVGAVDVEGDKISYKLKQAPTSGSVQLNPDGSYTYTPGAGFDGVDTFTVTADDPGLHVNVLNLTDRPGTNAGVLVNQGAIKFEFRYSTTEGGSYWTPEARAALQSTANSLAAYFMVTKPVILSYDIKGLSDSNSPTLASASSDLITSNVNFAPTVVQNKLLTGVDANGAAADGVMTVNWGEAWALGESVASNEYDFTSVLMHEMVHSFGWSSHIGEAGNNDNTQWPVFAGFVVTASGTKVIGSTGTWNATYDPNLTGANGGLYFGGANAVAAYGKPVPLYTPNPWSGGSSMSHLNDPSFTGPNDQMMNAKTDTGRSPRVLSPVEIGILKDLGYTVVAQSQSPAAVPVSIGFAEAA